jgi:hypothetical protein
MTNTATELALAPVRPGAATAWLEGTPPPGTPYRLPTAPDTRPGMTLAATTHGPSIYNNRMWDSQPRKTQTHGLRITDRGSCDSGWVHDNDLKDNAVAATRFDTAPSGGCWYHNHGIDECPSSRRAGRPDRG